MATRRKRKPARRKPARKQLSPQARQRKREQRKQAVSQYGDHLAWFCLFTFAVLSLLVTWLAPTRPTDPENLCAIFTQHGDWFEAAQQSRSRYSVPVYVIMAVMYQESSFYHEARPGFEKLFGVIPYRRLSTAHGYSQALDGTWNQYMAATGRKDAERTHFTDAYDFMGWYLTNASRMLKIKPDNAYSLYLTYHEGIGGYQQKTYKGKGFLLEASHRVQGRALRYQAQLHGCYDRLARPQGIREYIRKWASGE